MFKTIFRKLNAIFIIIIILAFFVTGVMLNFFLNSYFTDERARLLETSSFDVNRVFGAYIENIYYASDVSRAIMEQYLSNSLILLGNYTSSFIWIVDESGRIFRSNAQLPGDIVSKYTDNTGNIKIPGSRQFSRLIAEESAEVEIGDFNGFFKDRSFAKYGDLWLTVGRSFKYQDADGEGIMIVVYFHTPLNELKEARYAVFKYFLISVGAAVSISFILMYIFSLRITQPLKQIKSAAARIANGEFEKRLDIKSKDEIGELAKTFNQMATALQNLEEMRRGFVANVSHELRTPMTSIRGFVEGILDGTIPADKQNQYLTIVRDETNRLNRLVNDLLDLAKMEAGEMKLNIAVFDINELIRKSVIKLETLLLEKNLTVDADFEEEELSAMGDCDAIERVLFNLMHNAVKFTPEGGKITMITRKFKDRIEVTVKDAGVGIEEGELDLIWDRFYKSDKSRGRDKTGTGLGLAIARNIINDHGQSIRAQSRQGEGTAFTFTLARANNDLDTQ